MGETVAQADERWVQMDEHWEEFKASLDIIVEKIKPVEAIPAIQSQIGEHQSTITGLMEHLRTTA